MSITTVASPLSAGRVTMVLSLHRSLSAVFSRYERLGHGGLAILRALLTPVLSCSAVLLSSFLATASVEAIISY